MVEKSSKKLCASHHYITHVSDRPSHLLQILAYHAVLYGGKWKNKGLFWCIPFARGIIYYRRGKKEWWIFNYTAGKKRKCVWIYYYYYSCALPFVRLLKIFFTELLFLSCVPPLINKWKNIFYKIKFSFLCTPIDIV